MTPTVDATAPGNAAAVSSRLSFVEVDDPFNLRGKRLGGCYGDDAPIPRTKAATEAEEAESAAQHTGDEPTATEAAAAAAAAAAGALAQRDGNAWSSTRRSSSHGTGKENTTAHAPHRANGTADKPLARTDSRPNVKERKGGKQQRSSSAATPQASAAARVEGASADVQPSASLSSLASQQLPRLAPLLDDGVLRGLSSAVWTECVASIARLREAVEAHGGALRSEALEAAVLLLAHSPGLACTNQAVWKAASETCHALLLAAPLTVPAPFVRLVAPCLLSRLTDKRAAALCSSLLLQLAECSSARLLQRCVAACMDEQAKNARLVEQCLLFLTCLVRDFSLPALSAPSLLSLARSNASHPQQPVRAAVCRLLSSMYEQLGAPFRLPLLSSLAPSLHGPLCAALDEVDGATARSHATGALRSGRGEDSALVALSLDALFPRVELAAALDGVLAGLRDPSWKVRAASVQQLQAALEGMQHRVALSDGAALVSALSPLLSDSNALLAAQALSCVRRLVCDVGDGMARWREKLLPGVLAGCVDAKRAVREQATGALQEWLTRLGVASAMRLLVKALHAANSSGRLELLHALLPHCAAEAEWGELIPATLDCLCDKSAEVRAAADRLTGSLVAQCGYGAVNAALQRLKQAYVLQLQPLVDRHRHAKLDTSQHSSASSSGSVSSSRAAPHGSGAQQQPEAVSQPGQPAAQPDGSALSAEPTQPPPPSRTASHSGAGDSELRRKAGSGKRKQATASTSAGSAHRREQNQQQQQQHGQPHSHSQQAEGGSAGASVPASAKSAAAVGSGGVDSGGAECHPFLLRVDLAAKQKRLLRDGRRLQSGAFREWSAEEREETAHCLSQLVSPALHAALSSGDLTCLLHAVRFFSEQLAVHPQAVHAIADVLLRWLSALLAEASPKLLLAALRFLDALFASYAARGEQPCEAELGNALPFVIERLLGHNVQRVRRDASALLLSLARRGLCQRARLIAHLLQGADSKNKRVVAESCDCLAQLWASPAESAQSGANRTASAGLSGDIPVAVWLEMKRGLPQLALLVSSACEPTVRMSALSAVASSYGAIGEQLWIVLGGQSGRAVPEKALCMIEERVKRGRMDASAASAQPLAADTLSESRAPLPPDSNPPRPLTSTPLPLASTAAVQRTPVPASAPLPPPASPLSAVREARSRKQSAAPTLSALNSSLASLEAMHTTLAAQPPLQHASSDTALLAPLSTATAASAAALSPTQLPGLLLALSHSERDERVGALLSLSASLEQPGGRDLLLRPLVEHVHCVVPAIAGALSGGTLTAAHRQCLFRLSRHLCASRACAEALSAESAEALCRALLASTAAELRSGETAADTRELANDCVQALLECRAAMAQLTLLATTLLAALTGHSSDSTYLCSLLTPFLLRWAAAQRGPCELGAVDASSLLSWLHRLLVADARCGRRERCVTECADQLLLLTLDCAGGEQRAQALLSGCALDSPLHARMTALRQQSSQRTAAPQSQQRGLANELEEGVLLRAAAERTHLPAPPRLLALPTAETAPPTVAATQLSALLTQPAPLAHSSAVYGSLARGTAGVAGAASAVGLSYVERFHALQQRLRQYGNHSSAIHHTADFLVAHSAHASLAQPATPPRRGSTGMSAQHSPQQQHASSSSSPSATSSVSAILRDCSPQLLPSAAASTSAPTAEQLAPSAVTRSAAFEALRARMRERAAQGIDSDGGFLAARPTDAAPAESLSLSALLSSSPHPVAQTSLSQTWRSQPATAAYELASAAAGSTQAGTVQLSTVQPTTHSSPSSAAAACSGSLAGGGCSSVAGASTAVSALRARLAAIHAGSRAGHATATLLTH